MASTRLGYLALLKEATVATAVKPTNFLRFKDGDFGYNQEVIVDNPIQNNRWGGITPVKGKIELDGSYNFDFDANESIHFLYYGLGAVATTDVGSTAGHVYQHVVTLANTLPSYTLEQGKGNLTDTTNNRQNYQVDRAFGVMVDSFKISGNDGIINLEVVMKAHGLLNRALLIADASAGSSVAIAVDNIEGFVATSDTVNIFDITPQSEQKAIASINASAKTITIATLANSYTVANSAKVELVPQSPSYSVSPMIMSFINVKFQRGADLTAAASATEENIENWEFEYMNNLDVRYGSLRATPSVVSPKSAKATLKYTKYFENITDRDTYIATTKKACILTIENDSKIYASDTNNTKYSIKFELSDVRFTSYEMPTGTDEVYAVQVEAECFYDSSDGRAVRITAKNAIASYVA